MSCKRCAEFGFGDHVQFVAAPGIEGVVTCLMMAGPGTEQYQVSDMLALKNAADTIAKLRTELDEKRQENASRRGGQGAGAIGGD